MLCCFEWNCESLLMFSFCLEAEMTSFCWCKNYHHTKSTKTITCMVVQVYWWWMMYLTYEAGAQALYMPSLAHFQGVIFMPNVDSSVTMVAVMDSETRLFFCKPSLNYCLCKPRSYCWIILMVETCGCPLCYHVLCNTLTCF